MKKTLAFILFAALLISTILPMSIYAETPEDYSDYLQVYHDFEVANESQLNNNAGTKVFDDRAGSASKANNHVYINNNPNYLSTATSENYGNGKLTLPKDAGKFFCIEAGGTDFSTCAAVTIGFKLKLENDGSGVSTIYARTNGEMIQAVHSRTTGGYYLRWCNDGLTKEYTMAIFDNVTFNYDQEYYIFFVVEATTDTTYAENDVTLYYSADGKSFNSEKKENIEHHYTLEYTPNETNAAKLVEVGQVYRSGASGSDPNLGKASYNSVNKATVTFDNFWYFNCAINDTNSLSMVALHKMNIADKTAADAPAYRGCQLSAVENGLFSTRFVATVDSTQYSEVGFEITVLNYNGDPGEMQLYKTNTVFSSIIGTDTIGGGATVKYTAQDLGGTYIYACSVNKIPTTYAATFLITPYYVAVGSTDRVPSTSYEVTVYNGSVVSQSVYEAPAAE